MSSGDDLRAVLRRKYLTERGRRAGIASGEKRRKLAKGRRAFQATEAEVRRLFEKDCAEFGWDDQPGRRTFSERGFQTLLAAYRAQWRTTRGKRTRGFQTTNEGCSRALAARGRARCPRTVQRTRLRLSRMGLVAYRHIKRHGSMPGHRDSIAVYVLSPCRSAARTGTAYGSLPVPAPTEIAPPPGGRDRPPDKPAENGSDEKKGPELEHFDIAAARRSSAQRPSIFERYGVSLE